MFFDFFEEKPVIEFYCRKEHEGTLPEPVLASKRIADWWKKLPQHDDIKRDHFGSKMMTAKKCMPLLDAMSYGYIIPLQGDLHVITNHDCSIMKVEGAPERHMADFHDLSQIGGKHAPGYPAKPVKFINYWIIRTAPGWSTLFLPPINHQDMPFTCLSGLVDTDTYPKEVNFPAIWNKPNFDDKLSAGIPLVVAIPVKRKIIKNKVPIRKITEKETDELLKIQLSQRTRSSHYTNELREPRK
jgi:hypothetical protein